MATAMVNGISRPVSPGTLLSQLLAPDAQLETPCGGRGRCGKCRVIARGELSEPSEEEKRCLSEEELARGLRLACCTRALGDCEISTTAAAKAHVLADGDGLEPVHPLFSRYGAAVDIGTTTLAACLYGADGSLLARAGCMNPQAPWGADVISRISAALEGQGPALAQSVRGGINGLLAEMAAQAGISVHQLDGLVITGNTAMLYLLTETDPECLSHAPFAATDLFGRRFAGRNLGLDCPDATVYLPPCFAAFVGADTSTALLASGITRQPGIRLLADIGTNGEIALWDSGRLLCCSTAAGPAFEGAGLSMGMPGRDGAVDRVRLQNGALQAHVLGDSEPVGICGSGVVDALACLLETGQLDETGLLDPAPAVICDPVSLTQKDVRAIQLAKSAVAAGMETLVQTAHRSFEQLEELAVAGGFGSYLDVESAGRIGLLPAQLTDRVRVLGNAALRGAAMLLLDQSLAGLCEELTRQAEVVDLSCDPVFMQAYTDCMFFE